MQPRLAYAATIEVPQSLCESLAYQDGGLAPMVSESEPNIDNAGNSASPQTSAIPSTLLKPTSIFPKPLYSTADELMVSTSTKKSSTSDLIPVYPGNTQGLVSQEKSSRDGLTSSTTGPDLIMVALAESSKTGERFGRNSPASPPTVVNLVAPSMKPNFITIGYNDVHRLPTSSEDSFLDSWLIPFTLVVLLLILLVPAIRLGQACKAKFLAGLQEDYKLQTAKMKGGSAHIESKQEEADVPFDQDLPASKMMPHTLSPFQLSSSPSQTMTSSSPFSNVDVISLDGGRSLFSPTLKFENGAATVITTKAEVYVIDGDEGNHTPITTGITNFAEPSQLKEVGDRYKNLQREFSVLNVHLKDMSTTTYDYESCLNEESDKKQLSMLQVTPGNSQRFSSQYYPARSPLAKNQSLPIGLHSIGEKTTKTLRDSGSRRGSAYTGWGKDSKSWGVRQTKSSLARRKVVEMMMATGNVHSHCHYPKTRTSRPYAVT